MSKKITEQRALSSDRRAVREVPRCRPDCVGNFPRPLYWREFGVTIKSQVKEAREGNPQRTFFHSTSAHFDLLICHLNVSKLSSRYLPNTENERSGPRQGPRNSPDLFPSMSAGPRILRDSQGERAPGSLLDTTL